MTPGIVEAREINLSGITPIFLIGHDALSQQWLRARKVELKRINAIGYMINTDDTTAFQELPQTLASLNITLLPISASELALRLNLKHYPLLITEKGIEQ